MSVARVLKNNAVAVIGVALPLLLVLALVLLRALPAAQVPDPRHDLVLASGIDRGSQLDVEVREGRLYVRYRPVPPGQENYFAHGQPPELYYLDVDRMSLQRIPLELPVADDGRLSDQAQTLDVPLLAEVRLDPASVAPDGYRFEYDSGSGGGLLTGLWGGGYRYRHVLAKDGRRIKVPETADRYNTRLVGWVVAGELQESAQ